MPAAPVRARLHHHTSARSPSAASRGSSRWAARSRPSALRVLLPKLLAAGRLAPISAFVDYGYVYARPSDFKLNQFRISAACRCSGSRRWARSRSATPSRSTTVAAAGRRPTTTLCTVDDIEQAAVHLRQTSSRDGGLADVTRPASNPRARGRFQLEARGGGGTRLTGVGTLAAAGPGQLASRQPRYRSTAGNARGRGRVACRDAAAVPRPAWSPLILCGLRAASPRCEPLPAHAPGVHAAPWSSPAPASPRA